MLTLQLWSNVRNAFVDQPDLVELAENLSQNFESLYEKEVCNFQPLSFSLSFFIFLLLSLLLGSANAIDAFTAY